MAARWSSENVVVEFRDAQVFLCESSGANKGSVSPGAQVEDSLTAGNLRKGPVKHSKTLNYSPQSKFTPRYSVLDQQFVDFNRVTD